MTLNRRFSNLGLLAALVLPLASPSEAQVLKQLLNLRGDWKFALGDDPRRVSPSFNDGAWTTIRVPAYWEDEGYPGYDGYAWYRTKFNAPKEWDGKSLYIQLGRIDDADVTYLNGKPVGGRGSFPPEYRSAYGDNRRYPLSPSLLVFGAENTIAVRVYDGGMGGGIVGKEIGISEDTGALVPDEPLAGTWRFATGDEPSWKNPSYNDAQWQEIVVPAYWESQGYPNYDGYAWYRIWFRVQNSTADRDIILLLGKIDDVDEVYLNGEFLGRTGRMLRPGEEGSYGNAYQKLRAYTVPLGKLHTDRENLIAVKVHDNYRDGGIYEGPIGFVSRERYQAWTKRQDKHRSVWDVFDMLFK
jgi:sialate O-acetylesterase